LTLLSSISFPEARTSKSGIGREKRRKGSFAVKVFGTDRLSVWTSIPLEFRSGLGSTTEPSLPLSAQAC